MFVVGVGGSGLRRITPWEDDDGGNIDLYVMRLDGTHVQRVTRSTLWESAPDWGPR